MLPRSGSTRPTRCVPLNLRGESPALTMLAVASLVHVVVGMSGGRALDRSPRPSLRGTVALVALSLLADVDVVAFRLGIPYSAPFGHRGATHSIAFAMLAGAAAAALLPRSWRGPSGLAPVAPSGAAERRTREPRSSGSLFQQRAELLLDLYELRERVDDGPAPQARRSLRLAAAGRLWMERMLPAGSLNHATRKSPAR